jgi:hypothetical protein
MPACHFNQERHFVDRQTYRERRSTALAEWQLLPPKNSASLLLRAPSGDELPLD